MSTFNDGFKKFNFFCQTFSCTSSAHVIINYQNEIVERYQSNNHNHKILPGCTNQISDFADHQLKEYIDQRFEVNQSLEYRMFLLILLSNYI